jgi:hypothetical protein
MLRMVGSYGRYLSGVLVNTGTLVHENGSTYFNGASLQNSGTAEVRLGGWYNNTGTNSLVNTGTLNKTTTGSFTITVPMQQQNATVNVQAGTLTLSASSNTHQDVSWSVASGATLVLNGTHTFSGTHRGAIAGTLFRRTGTVQAGSEGATFTFTGTGYQWQEHTLNGGSAGLTNAGLLRMVGSYGRYLSGVLVNTGTLVHEAGSNYFNGASLQNSGTAEVRLGGWYNNTGTNSLVNTGTLNKTTTNNFTITVPMQQQGATVNVQAGTLTLSASSNTHQNVSWSVASGASLRLPSGTHTFVGTHSGAIAGTLLQTGGTVQAGSNGATFNFTGTGYQWQEGTLNGGSAGLTNAGLLRMVNSYGRYLSGVLVNTGTLVHEAGRPTSTGRACETARQRRCRGNWDSNTGTNSLVNTGTLRKVSPDPNNPTSFSITVNTTNSGLIEVRNGTLSVSNLTQTAGEARIRRGATLSVSNPLAMQGGKLTGAGTLSGALNNTAGTIAPGIDDPDQPDLNPLGILTINGNLTLGNDAIFEVELAGTDNSDPANPQYDRVVISGSNRTVQVNGTLRVKARDGYTPATGDTFDILVRSGSSWNRTGTFHTVEVDPDTLPCIAFEVQYLSDRVRLIARLTTDPDVNGDGCVDDADLLAVLFAFGQTGSGLAEDINCDQVVDDADLLSVLFAFGSGC